MEKNCSSEREGPLYARFGMLGRTGTFDGSPPSNFNESVKLSPSVMASRSTNTEKFAPTAANDDSKHTQPTRKTRKNPRATGRGCFVLLPGDNNKFNIAIPRILA